MSAPSSCPSDRLLKLHSACAQSIPHAAFPFSDVKVYDPSADSTIPTASKKRRFEEVEESEEPVEVKPKKVKKESVPQGQLHSHWLFI